MITLYPSPQTTRTIVQAVSSSKKVLWVYSNLKSLYFNPQITCGPLAGVRPTPADGGAAFGPDYIVMGGTNGFSAAARAAGLYTGSGLTSEFEDDAAASAIWNNVILVPDRGSVTS